MNIAENFLERASKIYKWLQDDESKRIYRAFIDYYVSGKYEARAFIDKFPGGGEFSEFIKQAFHVENLRKKGKGKAIVYGCGLMGIYALEVLRDQGIEIVAAIDRTPGMNQETFGDIPVRNVKDIKSIYDGEAILVAAIQPNHRDEMLHTLSSCGIEDNVFCADSDVIERNPCQYFDESIVKLSPGEKFVDCGGYDLFTTIRLNELCGQIGRAWVFEPDPENIKRCKANKKAENLEQVDIIEAGAYSRDGELSFSGHGNTGSCLSAEGEIVVPVRKIDDVVGNDQVTFIKMDIEGSELEALKGAANTITRNKPKLAICIYHKKEDLLEIPEYIKELCPDYKLYIRAYHWTPGDIVMYGVI